MAQSMFDPAYEFQAPKFFDFAQNEHSGEGDSFFEKQQQQSVDDDTFSMDEGINGQMPEVVISSKPPASMTKKPVLGTAMRALRLGNNAVVNKPTYLEVPKEKKFPHQSLKSRLPSPTVGVKKCKPKSPTKPKTFSFQTDQRAQVPRKRELFGSSSSRLGQSSSQGSTTSLNNANKPVKFPLAVKSPLLRARKSLVKSSKKILSRSIISKAASQENVRNLKRPAAQLFANMVRGRSASAGDISEKQPFKARPAPPRAPGSLPLKQNRPTTQTQPFNLQTEKVGQQHKLKMCMKVDEEEKRRKAAALFHAQPLPNMNKVFNPKTTERRTMGPAQLQLHTERRAEKRKAFDDATKKKEEEMKEQMEKHEKEQRRIDEEEIRNLRKMLVHQPKPILMAKPIEVKRGIVSSTVAVTPKFSTNDRLKARMLRQQNNPACKL